MTTTDTSDHVRQIAQQSLKFMRDASGYNTTIVHAFGREFTTNATSTQIFELGFTDWIASVLTSVKVRKEKQNMGYGIELMEINEAIGHPKSRDVSFDLRVQGNLDRIPATEDAIYDAINAVLKTRIGKSALVFNRVYVDTLGTWRRVDIPFLTTHVDFYVPNGPHDEIFAVPNYEHRGHPKHDVRIVVSNTETNKLVYELVVPPNDVTIVAYRRLDSTSIHLDAIIEWQTAIL